MPVSVKYKKNRATIARVRKGFYARLKKGGTIAKDAVEERLSASAMSLSEREKRGYPYARKRGKYGSVKSPQSRAPAQYIGKESGSIAATLKGTQRGFYYELKFGKGPRHMKYVFRGTKLMLPRNPMKALASKKIQKQIVGAFAKGKM